MAADLYFGTYARFDTLSKKDAGMLSGADFLVGDVFSIEIRTEDGQARAWVVNRFGGDAGFLDDDLSRRLSIMQARGWNTVALLSFVAYSDMPEPGCYWGEVAVIAYDPSLEEPMKNFIAGLGRRMADGIRPEVDLGNQAVASIVETNGSWQPKTTIPFPERSGGTVILKKHRKFSEQMIEQGRAGNKGCYVASAVIWIAIIALVVFGLKSCGAF